MAVMGFTYDPGPLPFCTIRPRDKWAPRLANGMIEIRGENGLKLSQQMVRVVKIEPYDGPLPAHLASLYRGAPLILVFLDHL